MIYTIKLTQPPLLQVFNDALMRTYTNTHNIWTPPQFEKPSVHEDVGGAAQRRPECRGGGAGGGVDDDVPALGPLRHPPQGAAVRD